MSTSRWYPPGQTRPAISASPWDVLVLGGTYIAGRAKVTAKAAWKVDEKKASGKEASRPTKHTLDTSSVEIEIEVINVDEMDAVNQAIAPYVPQPGGKFEPVTISHPAIDHLPAVKAITVREVSEWQVDGMKRRLKISGKTWVRSEKKATSKVETATKAPPNKRREDAERRGLIGGANPAPATQAGYCAPTFTPGVPQ